MATAQIGTRWGYCRIYFRYTRDESDIAASTGNKFAFHVEVVLSVEDEDSSGITVELQMTSNQGHNYMLAKTYGSMKKGTTKTLLSSRQVTFTKQRDKTTSAQFVFNGVLVKSNDSIKEVDQTVSCFTVPILPRYTITRYNNTSSSNGTKIWGENFNLGSLTTTSTGTSFVGWSSSSNPTAASAINYKPNANYNINASATLYSVYQRTLSVAGYNGQTKTGTNSKTVYNKNPNVSISVTTPAAPTKQYYQFQYWADNAQGGGTHYTANQAIPLTSNKNVYAIFAPQNYYVYYKSNNGAGTDVSNYGNVEQGITLFDNVDSSTQQSHFTRTNYSLIGWDELPNPTNPTYVLGQQLASLTRTMTLYAIWRLDYKQPNYSGVNSFRCDSTGKNDEVGTYARIQFVPTWPQEWDTTTNQYVNVPSYVNIKYYPKDDSENIQTVQRSFDGTETNVDIVIGDAEGTVSQIDQNKEYNVDIEIVAQNPTLPTYEGIGFSTYISTAFYVVDVNTDGTRWSFGKVATDNTGEEGFVQGVEFGVPVIDGFEVYSDDTNNTFFKVEEIKENERTKGQTTFSIDNCQSEITLNESFATYNFQTFETPSLPNDIDTDYPRIYNIEISFPDNDYVSFITGLHTYDRSMFGTTTMDSINWYWNCPFTFASSSIAEVNFYFRVTTSTTYYGEFTVRLTYDPTENHKLTVKCVGAESAESSTYLPSPGTITIKSLDYHSNTVIYDYKPAIHFGSNPADLSDSNIIYGVYTDGIERKIFELPNKSDNISIGYGAYQTAPPNSGYTNIYGQRINLRTKEGVYLEGHDKPIGDLTQQTVIEGGTYTTSSSWTKYTGSGQQITLTPGSYIIKLQLTLSALLSGASNTYAAVGYTTNTNSDPSAYTWLPRVYTNSAHVQEFVQPAVFTTNTTLTACVRSGSSASTINLYWRIMRIA